MFKLIYLYILKCADDTYYVGVTNNPEKRLIEHNTSYNPDSYTSKRLPVTLIWNESFTDFNLAFEWETKIKKWSARKKEALIRGDFNELISLSKKKFNNHMK